MTPSMQNLKIVSPYAHPLCISRVKFKSPSFEMFILFYFIFLLQVNAVRIIILSPFKIIIIDFIIIIYTCTIHLNP
jgi:hypothetical protein